MHKSYLWLQSHIRLAIKSFTEIYAVSLDGASNVSVLTLPL